MTFPDLDKPAQFLKGVGPVRAERLARMGIATARDLLYYVPRRYDDASTVQPISALEVGMDATLVGRVRSKGIIPTRSGLRIFQAVLQDDTGMITCAWPGQPWLDRKLQKDDLLLVTGPVKFFHGRQIQPRDMTLLSRAGAGDDDDPGVGTIFVSYPASEELPQWVLRGLFEKNLDALLDYAGREDYLGEEERRSLGLPGLAQAMGALHRPRSMADIEPGRRRLAYDELFFLQLVQAMARHHETVVRPSIRFERTNELIRPLHEALPFSLTDAQTRVLREIYDDMTSSRRMNRLLQGDVGSGKTIVALFSMLLAAEGGYQSALMVPTEILAEQHWRRLSDLVKPLGIETVLLTGSLATKERRAALAAIKSGAARVVIGTHALIQEGVDFGALGLVVVDEQQKFGVRQRMALSEEETAPDTLIMSATPIPRSLALAAYGDLDLSVLDELPPGRTPVHTRLEYPSKRDEVYAFIDRQIEGGRQAYVVYPLVEESEKLELRAATEEHRRLAEEVFPTRRVGLIHGQLGSGEKDEIMRDFLRGGVDILVATTVIEVGIDVANATVMLIEHPERFGLSQLHQLRGRVGRGAADSHCIIISPAKGDATERLKIFRDISDGFAIAQADLGIRGQGDLFGAQQHGRDLILRFADLSRDEDLLVAAQHRARDLVSGDPELSAPAHAGIRRLLDGRYGEKLKLFSVG
ncbi:MAG: ATP-dependent DNA helicase RecG [Longimicrobiales bacterium]